MKTKWYFIIAGAAVAAFAAYYQDFARAYDARQAALAAEADRQRAARIEQQRRDHQRALDLARVELERRRREKEERAKAAAETEAWRADCRAQLSATRDESAALERSHERLAREIADLERQIAAQQSERDALAQENAFLDTYLAEATASGERLAAVAERAVQQRTAARATPTGATRQNVR